MAAQRAGLTLRKRHRRPRNGFRRRRHVGIGEQTAAPLETRLAIRLDFDAPAAALEALVEQALAIDPYYLALRDPQVVKTSVTKG